MKSKALPSLWKCYEHLPAEIRELAKAKYRLWRNQPFHVSLQFKEVRPQVWSIRISQEYRALALENEGLIVWYWIGSHNDYDARL